MLCYASCTFVPVLNTDCSTSRNEKKKKNGSEKCCLLAFGGANRHGTKLFACRSSEIASHTSLLAPCCIAPNKRFTFSMTGSAAIISIFFSARLAEKRISWGKREIDHHHYMLFARSLLFNYNDRIDYKNTTTRWYSHIKSTKRNWLCGFDLHYES